MPTPHAPATLDNSGQALTLLLLVLVMTAAAGADSLANVLLLSSQGPILCRYHKSQIRKAPQNHRMQKHAFITSQYNNITVFIYYLCYASKLKRKNITWLQFSHMKPILVLYRKPGLWNRYVNPATTVQTRVSLRLLAAIANRTGGTHLVKNVQYFNTGDPRKFF